MEDFKQNKRKSFGRGHGSGFGRRDRGRPNFPKKNWGESGNRDRGPATMHQTICNQCGKPCEVPFRPTHGKPVYCDICFRNKREAGNNRGGDRFPQKKFNNYKTHIKTDFGGNASKGGNDELKNQLVILNVKMDQLIRAVEAIVNIKPLVAGKKMKEAVKTAPTVKVKKLAKRISKKKKN